MELGSDANVVKGKTAPDGHRSSKACSLPAGHHVSCLGFKMVNSHILSFLDLTLGVTMNQTAKITVESHPSWMQFSVAMLT